MRTQKPIATTGRINSTLGAIVVAVVVAQLAFVTVSGAAMSETHMETHGTAVATPAPVTPEGVEAIIAPGLPVGGARVDESGATESSASAQTVDIWHLYIHPFWPDECFWACFEIICPCVRIVITFP